MSSGASRRASSNVILEATGLSSPSPPIPFEPTQANSGVLILPYGAGLVLLAIATDNRIRYTAFSGSAWSAWSTLAEGNLGVQRTSLAGAAPREALLPSFGRNPAARTTISTGSCSRREIANASVSVGALARAADTG